VLLVAPLLPVHYLSDQAGLIVDRGVPELTGWLVAVQVVLGLALWFLLAGTATLVYLSLVRREEEA
jgi:branched-subunit amino acid transport protein AzlD